MERSKQGTGDGDALSLTLTQSAAPFGTQGVEPFGQIEHEIGTTVVQCPDISSSGSIGLPRRRLSRMVPLISVLPCGTHKIATHARESSRATRLL